MTTNIRAADVDDMTPTIVATSALGALVGNLALAEAADRSWEAQLSKYGQTIQIPVRGALTANAKSADTDVTVQTVATTNVQVTLDNHYEITVALEDIAKAFANQDVLAGYGADAAVVLAEKIETTGFVAAYTNFTTNADIGTATVDATDEMVLTVRKVLHDAKPPPTAPKYLFLSTKDMLALLQLPKYSEANKLGDGGQRIANGPMRFQMYGMTFIESQYIQVVSTTTHNLGLVGGTGGGLVLAMRPLELPEGGVISAAVVGDVAGAAGYGLRVIKWWNGAKLATQMTLDALWGWKVQRGAFGQDFLA